MWEALKWKAPRLAGLALAAAAAFFACAGSAQAQPFFGFFGDRTYSIPETLSPELVYRHLVRTGYQPIGRIQRNGRVFLADVLDPRRRQLRLVIDSFDGTILERYVIAARAPVPLDERPLTRPSAPMADPNLPPPRLLPAPSARTEPDAAPRAARPRTVSRQPAQDSAPRRNRAAVRPAPPPEAAPQPESAEASQSVTTEAPAPSRTTKPQAPKAPEPKGDGSGYANGVPINPLE